MKKYKIIFLVCFACLQACHIPSGQRRFVFENIQKTASLMELKDWNRSLSFVALETLPECLINASDINTVIVIQENIYVGVGNGIYRFSRQGKFLNRIGSQGRGPGEYFNIQCLWQSPEQQNIFCSDIYKIIEYGPDGTFINEYPKTAAGATMLCLDRQENFLLSPFIMFGNEKYKLTVMNRKCELTSLVNNHIKFKPEQIYYWPDTKMFFQSDGEIVFHQNLNDTVYTYNPDTQSLNYRYSLDFGPIGIDEKFYKNMFWDELKKIGCAGDITEDAEYIYISVWNLGKEELYLVKKETVENGGPEFCKADFRYSPDFKSEFRPRWVWNDLLIDCLDIHTLNYLFFNEVTDEVRRCAREFLANRGIRSEEDSNPVIVIAYPEIDKN